MRTLPLTLAGVLEPTWGSLKGRFVLDGKVVAPRRLVVTKDQHVCGKHELFDEKLVIHPEDNGIQNIVVSLYVRRDAKPRIHESYQQTAASTVTLDNEWCRFNNHVVAMRTSQTLLIRNLDAVGHNTKIDAISNQSINPILAANTELEHRFEKAERIPVPVSCSIHPWMNGYLLVQDHPYFAVSDENGCV